MKVLVPGPVRLPSILAIVLFLLGYCSSSRVDAAPKVYPVEEFTEVVDKWVGLPVTIRGRWSVYSDHQLKLRNLPIFFHSEARLTPLIRRTSNLQVTGTLTKTDGKLTFEVSNVIEVESDLEEFGVRKRQAVRNSAQDWYKLADWAQAKGTFYHDPALLKEARDCRQRGFQEERKRLPPDNPAPYRELAERCLKLGGSEKDREELIHQSLIIRRENRSKVRQPEPEQQLLEEIRQSLPGSDFAPPDDDPELRRRYLANPVFVYAHTEPVERKSLHRILWSEIVLKALQRELHPKATNGFEIAAKIEEQVPEFHHLAEEYREQALAQRASQVENLSRAEVLKLREEFQQRGQPDQGNTVVQSWLQTRRKKLQPQDLGGLIQIAELYTELLNQPQTTRQILLEMGQRFPDSEELAPKLIALGYRKHQGQWISNQEFAASEAGRLEEALKAGRVEIGMPAKLVLKSQGAPTSWTRIVASGIVQEVWVYSSPGQEVGLTVYLSRPIAEQESRVIGINQLP